VSDSSRWKISIEVLVYALETRSGLQVAVLIYNLTLAVADFPSATLVRLRVLVTANVIVWVAI